MNFQNVSMDSTVAKNVLETVGTPRNFNWAWQYFDEAEEQWVQFDCPDCLQLEFHYHAYKLSG